MMRHQTALIALLLPAVLLTSVGVLTAQSVNGGTTDRAVSLTGQTVTFQITGLVNAQIYTADITECVSPVINCSSPNGNTFKAAGTSRNWNINFSTAATPGTGRITLNVSGSTGTYFIKVRRTFDVAVTPD